MDVLTPEQRRRCMAAIGARDTKPELRLRKALHALGYRYRLHDATLPGRPDLVFPARQKIVFVHGCFWHRHRCKSGRSLPATRRRFWMKKLSDNTARDRRTMRALRKRAWSVFVAWECQLGRDHVENLLERVTTFLEDDGDRGRPARSPCRDR